MDDVLKKADDLARAIRSSDRYRTLKTAETAVADDEEARTLTVEFEEAQRTIAEKQEAAKPIEVEDKHRVAELQERIAASKNLQELLRAQADFYEMMNRVNGTIRSMLGGDEDG